MFEFIKKKKTGGNGPNTDSDGEKLDIEVPDAESGIDDLDAALAQADAVKAAKVKEEKRAREREAALERERYSSGSRCGCG